MSVLDWTLKSRSYPSVLSLSSFPQFAFNRWIIESTHEFVSAYKPNTAFYEAHGAAGIHELEMTMEYLRMSHPGIVTICDAKGAITEIAMLDMQRSALTVNQARTAVGS